MRDNEIINDYFEWLYQYVTGESFPGKISYRKLMTYLHSREFIFKVRMDENRAKDGINLRYRYACERGYNHMPACLDGPCSVLEMMLALASRCEETIMDDATKGDRTGQWFWGMIANLGLNGMYDDLFDKADVEFIIDRLLNRKYAPDGTGGLFTVRHCGCDLRKVEIWHQLCWYLDTIS